MHKVIIPNEFKVGFVERGDTFTGKLGFMIYGNRDDGTYGQQKSYDNWRNKSIEEKLIKNHYQLGFILNKGRLNHYRFGASAKFRVFHPEGFEFEISLENLSLILGYTTVSSGEINLPCCIGWIGKSCYLIPQVDLSKEIEIHHQNIEEKIIKSEKIKKSKEEKNLGKPIQRRSLTGGKIVETNTGDRYYISKVNFSNRKNITLKASTVSLLSNGVYKVKEAEARDEITAMFSLSRAYGKMNGDETFVKFVEQKDLTSEEKSLFLKYSREEVIFFDKNFECKKLDLSSENILSDEENLFSKLENNNYRYINEKIMLNNFVKKNGVVYALRLSKQIYSSFYGINRVVRISEGTERYGEKIFEFYPIMSLSETNNIFITDSYSVDTADRYNLKRIIKRNFEELTNEDLEIVNKKLLRVFE